MEFIIIDIALRQILGVDGVFGRRDAVDKRHAPLLTIVLHAAEVFAERANERLVHRVLPQLSEDIALLPVAIGGVDHLVEQAVINDLVGRQRFAAQADAVVDVGADIVHADAV